MNITEVRVKLMQDRTDRLRAFCSVTIDDDFVVHDLRVIEGRKGFFVAMPSRKLTANCPHCGAKNELRAKYCNTCGDSLPDRREEGGGSDKYHVDVAHPINTPCREVLQTTVLAAYEEEARRAREGLEPLHEYTGAGLEELAEDYEEAEEEEQEEVQAAPEEPEAEPEPAATEPVEEAEEEEEEEEEEEGILTYAQALAEEEAGEPELISAWDDEEEVGLEPEEEGPEPVAAWEEVEAEEVQSAPEPEEPEPAPEPTPVQPEAEQPEEEEPEEEEPGSAGKGPKRSLRERETGGFGEGIL